MIFKPTEDTVNIVSPDGKFFTIRSDDLDSAIVSSSPVSTDRDSQPISSLSSSDPTPEDLIPILTEAVAKMSNSANQMGGPSQSAMNSLSTLLGAYGIGAYSAGQNTNSPWASALKQTSSALEVFTCSKPIDGSAVEGNGRCMHYHCGKCLMMGDCEFKFKEGDI